MPNGEMVSTFASHWWVLLLRGIFAVLFGLMALFLPGLTLVTLILLCGFYFILDGMMALLIGGRAHTWTLLGVGVLGIIAGVLTFIFPGLTGFSLLILIAAWAIVTGIFEVIAAIRLRKEISNEWMLIIGGAISVLFGVVLLTNPAAGALAMIWVIGAYAIVFGITMCVLAFRLRQMPHQLAGAISGR
jgi:uncharacterized membrane protein HdeD (DUF308 family)